MTEHNPLKFKSLSIDVGQYGDNKDKITCKVRTERWDTALDTILPNDVVIDIMKLISPVIAASVHQSLLDVQRDHEQWMLGQQVDADATAIEDNSD